jgi:GT2 family glycosyltransferase
MQQDTMLPIRVVEIELGQPLPILSAVCQTSNSIYRRARCLVRLHDQPLGMVDIAFDKNELAPQDYISQIWLSLSPSIVAHMQQDGIPPITRLDPEGIVSSTLPHCLAERNAFSATAPFVSVIVSTHNRPDALTMCLSSLLALCYPHYEVIIVDNAPSSNATENLIQHVYGHVPQLRYIREDRPGLSIGLNRGVAEARGEILAFTDDDVKVDSYWLLELVRAFSRADDVVCVTNLILPLELETPAQLLFEEYGGFSKGFQRQVYDMAAHRPPEPLYPYTAGRFGTGAGMACRPVFLRSLGGFDPALQCGMDITTFFQAVRGGHTLVYEPAAIVYHAHRRTYAELRRQIYQYGIGLTAYLTKNMLEHPQLLGELLTKIPYGLYFTLSTRSPKNRKKSLSYPRDLTLLELKGMLLGPFTYIHRKWHYASREQEYMRL